MSHVSEAREALEREQAAERGERRSKLLAQLAEVHKQRVEAEAAYTKVAGKIKAEREQQATIRAEMRHLDELIADSFLRRPAMAPYLPDAPDCAQWAKRHDDLQQERDKALARLKAVHQTPILEAVKYEGVGGILATLAFSENNLLSALDPESVRQWKEGSITPVS